MKKAGNICKFASAPTADGWPSQLGVTNFVYETELDGNIEIKLPAKNAMYLAVCGEGRLRTEYCEKKLSAGTLFFTFSGGSYTIENRKDFRYMYITFGGERAAKLLDRFDISQINCVFEGYESLICFWKNSLEKAIPQNFDLLAESVLLYSFSAMEDTYVSGERHLINDIIKYLEDNFSDRALSLESLSDEMNYSSKYISRIFRKNVGVTFTEYLCGMRMRHAMLLIDSGITSVQNAALLSGYSDPFYFSTVFKKTVGISPSEYIGKKKKTTSENK